jgi:Holliday junction resolvase-like predicted endonuclease
LTPRCKLCKHHSNRSFDIVCREGDVTFIEAFGRPADAVTLDKQCLIQRGASEWLKMLNRPVINFRFDIAEVILTEGQRPHINVIENAFQLPAGNMMGRVRGSSS